MYAAPITYKVNGPGTEETAEGFVARPVRYSTIDVNDLADHISADSRVERSKVAVITDSLIKQIREMVLNGHAIEVPHLGIFKPKIKSKMFATEEDMNADSFLAKVTFRPCAELKRDLQSTRIEKVEVKDSGIEMTPAQLKQNIINATIAEFNKSHEMKATGGEIKPMIVETVAGGKQEFIVSEAGNREQEVMSFGLLTPDSNGVWMLYNKDAQGVTRYISPSTEIKATLAGFMKVPRPIWPE